MLNYLMLIFAAEKPVNQRTCHHNYCKTQKIAVGRKKVITKPGKYFRVKSSN